MSKFFKQSDLEGVIMNKSSVSISASMLFFAVSMITFSATVAADVIRHPLPNNSKFPIASAVEVPAGRSAPRAPSPRARPPRGSTWGPSDRRSARCPRRPAGARCAPPQFRLPSAGSFRSACGVWHLPCASGRLSAQTCASCLSSASSALRQLLLL